MLIEKKAFSIFLSGGVKFRWATRNTELKYCGPKITTMMAGPSAHFLKAGEGHQGCGYRLRLRVLPRVGGRRAATRQIQAGCSLLSH